MTFRELKILLRFRLRGLELVLIKWLINGRRLEERVPLSDARHRKYELEAQGAIVYWSERTYF
tara:strand:- start:1217 stop:1405 length:189 start_codon:yes stop_codon:yes gene_type:complete